MKGNFHVRFGERGGETRWPQGQKVRSAPTLRTGGFLVETYDYLKLQAQVSALRAAQAKTGLELSALMPSILDRAFKGEL